MKEDKSNEFYRISRLSYNFRALRHILTIYVKEMAGTEAESTSYCYMMDSCVNDFATDAGAAKFSSSVFTPLQTTPDR